MRRTAVLKSLSAVLALAATPSLIAPAHAFTSKDKTKPSGTLLLPLTPRIDDGTAAPPLPPETTIHSSLGTVVPSPDTLSAAKRKAATAKAPVAAPAARTSSAPKAVAGTATAPSAASAAAPAAAAVPAPPAPASAPSSPVAKNSADPVLASQPTISPEAGNEDLGYDGPVDENSLLKGTVQIVADDTEYDQEKNTFLGTGNAVAIIAGQNSKLEADTILYDQNNGTIDARGNVKILRNGQLTTGSSFKFNINSDEYLITSPDTELQGTTVVARTAKGNREGLMFKDGQFTMPKPMHVSNNGFAGPVSMAERVLDLQLHPEAYVPKRGSYKFTARKMVYERYKEDGNLTIFGGKLVFDHFTMPLPKFTANVGAQNTRVVFPITPMIGNNMNVGGVNLGPQFNYAVGKSGVFAWAPLLQIGGRSYEDGRIVNNTGKLGGGVKIGYTSDRMTAHFAYGSVSNLPVADFKYRFTKRTMFQSGINRFLNDGLFGMRRAGKIAEVVDMRGVTSIPYISYLSFRTSGGWAQDNPSLMGLSGSQYAKLFGYKGHKGNTSAWRFQEQISATTHPIFALGDSKYGADMMLTGGVAARAYSTGDSMLMGQVGPMMNVRADRLRARFGYMQSGVSGQSPFVFDQFIQGQRSVYLQGDVKITKWLTLGTNLGYNLDKSMLYSRAITAAVGPDDFKLLFTRDTISGYQRFGFDILCGQPVRFDKLVVKGAADAGQLGGI